MLRVFSILIVACIAGAQATSTPPTRVELRCGAVLDVRSGKLLSRQTIVVVGNKITGIAPSSAGKEAGASIDLSSLTCLPGLIDMHTHLTDSDGPYDLARPMKLTGAQMAFESIPNAKATLMAGFTTVRDVGPFRAFVDVALRDAIDQGIVPGPRMVPAGAYVTISGGAGTLSGFAPDIELPLELRYGVADGPDQVRQRVREIIRHGAGVIKILSTGAVLTMRSQPGAQEFNEDEIRAAVEEASKAGLRVACHAHAPAGIKAAVRAGVASIEHGSFLDEEALQMMKQHGTYLVPDMYDDYVIMADKSLPAEYHAKEKVAGDAQRWGVRRAIALGVKIAFGTDAAVIPHGDNGKQFNTYVNIGMTPLFAIQTATINAADLLGWPDRVGVLEAGKLADIIAVRGNPLENVRTLENVSFVMKDGTVYKNETASTR
jgi:imidazolonepropionase-like amidohydrolase